MTAKQCTDPTHVQSVCCVGTTGVNCLNNNIVIIIIGLLVLADITDVHTAAVLGSVNCRRLRATRLTWPYVYVQ